MGNISSQFSSVVFPAKYESEQVYRLNNYLQQGKNDCEARKDKIKSERIRKKEVAPQTVSFLSECAYYICPIIAFLVTGSLTDSFGMEFGLTIVFGLIAFAAVFFPIGFLYNLEAERVKKRDLIKEKEALREYKDMLEEQRLQVLREEIKFEEKQLFLHDKAESELVKYKEDFDKAVALTVKQYSQDRRVCVIADWFTDKFNRAIIRADRQIDQAKVVVISDIDVYADRIDSNLGEFSFSYPPIDFTSTTEAFRLTNLVSPVHQAALCRVLLQIMQMDIKSNNPRDPSGGGNVKVQIGCKYAYDYAHGRIQYSANNKNYVPERHF